MTFSIEHSLYSSKSRISHFGRWRVDVFTQALIGANTVYTAPFERATVYGTALVVETAA